MSARWQGCITTRAKACRCDGLRGFLRLRGLSALFSIPGSFPDSFTRTYRVSARVMGSGGKERCMGITWSAPEHGALRPSTAAMSAGARPYPSTMKAMPAKRPPMSIQSGARVMPSLFLVTPSRMRLDAVSGTNWASVVQLWG